MILLLYYLPGEAINVFASFDQDGEPVVPIEYCSIGPSFQAVRLPRSQRCPKLFGREPPKLRELDSIQQVVGVEEPQSGLHFVAAISPRFRIIATSQLPVGCAENCSSYCSTRENEEKIIQKVVCK
jgi:hypothetical protein